MIFTYKVFHDKKELFTFHSAYQIKSGDFIGDTITDQPFQVKSVVIIPEATTQNSRYIHLHV